MCPGAPHGSRSKLPSASTTVVGVSQRSLRFDGGSDVSMMVRQAVLATCCFVDMGDNPFRGAFPGKASISEILDHIPDPERQWLGHWFGVGHVVGTPRVQVILGRPRCRMVIAECPHRLPLTQRDGTWIVVGPRIEGHATIHAAPSNDYVVCPVLVFRRSHTPILPCHPHTTSDLSAPCPTSAMLTPSASKSTLPSMVWNLSNLSA